MSENKPIIIIGGGIAGLMMGYALSKRGFSNYLILESAPSEEELVKRSHIYYIHSIIEDVKHLLVEKPIQPYVLFKGNFYDKSNPQMCNLYANRITQKSLPTAIHHIDGSKKTGWFPESGNMRDIVYFYLAGQKGTVRYGANVDKIYTDSQTVVFQNIADKIATTELPYSALVNTVPLPNLLSMAGIESSLELKFSPIHTYRGHLTETQDLHQEVYIPLGLDSKFYRFLVYHNTVIAESTERSAAPITEIRGMMDKLGLVASSLDGEPFYWPLPNGRFIPIDNERRKAFVRMLTDSYNIFSFGRYGTWSYRRADHLPKDAEELISIIKAKGTML